MSGGADIRGGRLAPAEYEANFGELYPPLDRKLALVEASRCYFCFDAPCIAACPTQIDIPGFIRGIQTDNVKGAALRILEANIMGGTCARVCPTEVLCEGACVRTAQEGKPVKIGLLQRYATDWLYDQGLQPFERAPPTGRRVAVIGAGPAGLACAHALARLGHDIVVFEKRPKAGGLNEHGIAAYKVPYGFAQREVDFILGIGGIELRHGITLGRDVHLRDLRREFEAVFLAIGLGAVNALGLEGEHTEGVLDAVDYIERLRQTADLSILPVGRNIVVIGGGNTAIDIAVQTKRLGADTVTLVYRRGPAQMSATRHEQEVAQLNGVTIRHWARPVALVSEAGRLQAVEFAATELAPADLLADTGRRFTLPADQLFKAIGQKLVAGPGNGSAGLLEIERGKIRVDGSLETTLPGVWAGGDCVGRGEDLTVMAVEDGKRAAAAIHHRLLQG
jgi:dihydropyrimidine dehydrogenase (NAD+) subunit PreT